jgi:Asp-tRNA(Asn)/Glu-tRNA(Gln) amidotransferase A subunit family amidase
MRTTSNNDVNFAMDVPPVDSTVVADLRAKGAIIYAKSAAHEFNGVRAIRAVRTRRSSTGWMAGR